MFWAEGMAAYPAEITLKEPDQVCCVGVDMPGVGFTHAADCAVQPGTTTRFPGDHQRQALSPSLLRLLCDLKTKSPLHPLGGELAYVDLAIDLICAANELERFSN